MRLFYARRALRLYPAFFLLVFFLMVMQRMGLIALHPGDLLAAFTYTVNFRMNNSWYIGHLWSLSVEEQFYLMWPIVLALGGRKGAGKQAGTVVLLAPVARIITARLGLPGAISPCVADSLACGCLVAICSNDLEQWPLYTARMWASKYFLPAPPSLVLFACNWSRKYTMGTTLGLSVINLLLAIVVHRCVALRSKTAAFLSFRPLVWFGLLSYSLYLWQQFFLNGHSTWVICHFPFNLLLAVLAAITSYYCVERPLNDFRRKLRRKPNPAAQSHDRTPPLLCGD